MSLNIMSTPNRLDIRHRHESILQPDIGPNPSSLSRSLSLSLSVSLLRQACIPLTRAVQGEAPVNGQHDPLNLLYDTSNPTFSLMCICKFAI